MKTLLYCLLLLIAPAVSFAQSTEDTIPPYKKDPNIPALKILETDSVSFFSRDDLPKNRPVVIVYFNPDCGHCQLEAKEIADHMATLDQAFFVWISYGHPEKEIKAFFTKYGLSKFKNVRIGQDPHYYIPSYYRVAFTPYIAVYSAKGKFVTEFRDGAQPEQLQQAIEAAK